MNKSMVARAVLALAAPAIAIVPFTAGAASAGTVAAQSSWSAYYWNSGNSLGGPQAVGTSTDPSAGATVPFTPQQYLAKVVTKEDGSLLGKTVTINGTFTGSGFDVYGYSPSPDPYVRLYFTGAGGGDGYYSQQWWSDSPAQVDFPAGGMFTLTLKIDASGWSDWNGKLASDNVSTFDQAASHAQSIGLSFGGGSFFENGVAGSGTLEITGFSVSD